MKRNELIFAFQDLRLVEKRGIFANLFEKIGVGAIEKGALGTVVHVEDLEEDAEDHSHHDECVHDSL